MNKAEKEKLLNLAVSERLSELESHLKQRNTENDGKFDNLNKRIGEVATAISTQIEYIQEVGKRLEDLKERLDLNYETLKNHASQLHRIQYPTPAPAPAVGKTVLVVVDRAESARALCNVIGFALAGIGSVRVLRSDTIQIAEGHTFHIRSVQEWGVSTLRAMHFDDVLYLARPPHFVMEAIAICMKGG